MRQCRICGESKEPSEFYTHKNGSLYLDCKPCWREYVKRNRYNKIEQYILYDRIRGDNPKRKEASTRYKKKRLSHERKKEYTDTYNKRFPEKRSARIALGNAIRDRRITRPDKCEICGVEVIPHGHHEDYTKPFDVIWCCAPCHGNLHRKSREHI